MCIPIKEPDRDLLYSFVFQLAEIQVVIRVAAITKMI